MLRSIHLGRAFGIPLYLHPTFFLLPLYVLAVSLGEGMTRVVLSQLVLFAVFGCVLLHELGHALTGRLFGIATRDITLYPMGGVARLDGMGSRPHEEIAIALAGPAVNLVIFVLLLPVFLLAMSAGLVGGPEDAIGSGGTTLLGFAAHFVTLVCFSNAALLVFNLIPAFPMDGGRVLRALLSLGMPRLDATRIAATVGLIAAGGLALFGLFGGFPQLVLVALFVGFAGQMELASLKRQEARPILDAVPVEPWEARGGFTGMAWDQHRGVWVRWVDGRVVGEQ
jgi:Zn-dependent protease